MARFSKKKSAFRQYNTDSDDSETITSTSSSSTYYSYGSDSLLEEEAPIPNLEPSVASAPLGPESNLTPDSVGFTQRVSQAKTRRQLRDARINATSPSATRLAVLEVLSIVFLGWAAVCCIVSGHPPLVALIGVCLFFPMKVICPVLEDIERHDAMVENDARLPYWEKERLKGKGGGNRPTNEPAPTIENEPSLPVRKQRVNTSQEAKHKKFLKSIFRAKRDVKLHGQADKLGLVGDATEMEFANHTDTVSVVDQHVGGDDGTASFVGEPYVMGGVEYTYVEPTQTSRMQNAPETQRQRQEPVDTIPLKLTSENLKQLESNNIDEALSPSRLFFDDPPVMNNKNTNTNNNNNLPSKSLAAFGNDHQKSQPSPMVTPQAKRTVRFHDGAGKPLPPIDSNSQNLKALEGDRETAVDPAILQSLRKLHRKRKVTFGQSSFVNGEVSPGTYWVLRRWQVIAGIVYCGAYFLGVLVIESFYSSGGVIEDHYNEQVYRSERSKHYYLGIPFWSQQREQMNANILANNASHSTLPPIDGVFYDSYMPNMYVCFSLFVSSKEALEMTVAIVMMIAFLIIAITMLAVLPKRVRYYDHQDDKRRRTEGYLNYVTDTLYSRVRDDMQASVLLLKKDVTASNQPIQQPSIMKHGQAPHVPSLNLPKENNHQVAFTFPEDTVECPKDASGKTTADVHQERFISYWTDADMQVATSVLTLNSLTSILQKRLDDSKYSRLSKGIGEMRFDYTPLHANRRIRVSQLTLLLTVLLVAVSVLPSFMVGLPILLILSIVATTFTPPPKIANALPPFAPEVMVGEHRRRSIRFPFYIWHPSDDQATKFRSFLIVLLYYTLALVFVGYVGFQNPVLEDFNTMPKVLPEGVRFSAGGVQHDFYHRVGLYNIRTFLSTRISKEEYANALASIPNVTYTPIPAGSAIDNFTADNSTTEDTSFSNFENIFSSVDVDNGLGIPNHDTIVGRVIVQISLLFVAIFLARSLPCSLFIVVMPEYEEDKAFMRQVERLKTAQRNLLRKVRRLERTEEKPALEMPTFDEKAYLKEGCPSPSNHHSPDRNTAGASPPPKSIDADAYDPLKGLEDAKVDKSGPSLVTPMERAVELLTSFLKATLTVFHAFVFKFSPIVTPPAYAVYTCVSPSFVSALVIFPLIVAFCFSSKRWRLTICKLLFLVEICYMTALVAVFSLELQYENLPILRWFLIGSKSVERSLNLSTINFLLGIHSICLVLLITTTLVFLSANAEKNEDEKGPRLGRGETAQEQIDEESSLAESDKCLLLRDYAVDLEQRARKDKQRNEKLQAEAHLKKVAPGTIFTSENVANTLAADEKINEVIAMNSEMESRFRKAPIVEVASFVRQKGEHYRRKRRIQALVEANNILGTDLVKMITALYECRYDDDCYASHARLLDVQSRVEYSLSAHFKMEAERAIDAELEMMTSPIEALSVLKEKEASVIHFSQKVVRASTERMVAEALSKQAQEGNDSPSRGFNDTVASAEATYGGHAAADFDTTTRLQRRFTAQTWSEEICQLDVQLADANPQFHAIDLDKYSKCTRLYRDDFEAIRKNVMPHIAWALTSAELLTIHRYVLYYCPPPRFDYIQQNGVAAFVPGGALTDTSAPRPPPADGSPFAEMPINLDDLLIICACFKGGGSFLEKDHEPKGEAHRKRRDAVIAVLEQDNDFCNREYLEAGGPLRTLRGLIETKITALQRGANDGRGAGIDLGDTRQFDEYLRSAMDGLNVVSAHTLPIDPALQAAARHVNFSLQHRVLEAFPTREERGEGRRRRRIVERMLKRRIQKLEAQLNAPDANFDGGVDNRMSMVNASLAFVAEEKPEDIHAAAPAPVEVVGVDDDDDESFLKIALRKVRYVLSEIYMWSISKGKSIYNMLHRIFIGTYFAVGVVGFGVAGYRNYFTFLHFALMLFLVFVLWSQLLSVTKQIYLLNAYIAVTAIAIMSIIVISSISAEWMADWGTHAVMGKPISGTGANTEPLLVSIGVQGFQRTSWELLLYFLQFFVAIVQRKEYYRVRKTVYSRAQLVHVSLPVKAPSFYDEDDIDVRFEKSCIDNYWNDALDVIEGMYAAAQREQRKQAKAHETRNRGLPHGHSRVPQAATSAQYQGAPEDFDEDDGDAYILTTRGLDGDVVPVETRYLVSENRWDDLKAWVEWRLLMTSAVFIRLQMYVAVIVGVPLFISIEGFNTANYWTMFFLIFFICLLTYSIRSSAFESKTLSLLWLWALVIATVATLTTAAYQSDPFQSWVRLKFEDLRQQGRFVGQFCARVYTDGFTGVSNVTTNAVNPLSTPLEIVTYCLEEIGYASVLRESATVNGYAHFAVILVVSVVQYTLLSRYYAFYNNHPLPKKQEGASALMEAERQKKINELRGTSIEMPTPRTPGGKDEDDIEMDAIGVKEKEPDPPASLGFMNMITVAILTVIRDNCEKLHWAMCIVSALHVRSLTHAIYVLFFVFGLTGWVPLCYSVLHLLCIYFYPISLFDEYWHWQKMEWVGVAKNTPQNPFSDKVTLMVGPVLVFLASLLFLNTTRFSQIENAHILLKVKQMEMKLKDQITLEALVAGGKLPHLCSSMVGNSLERNASMGAAINSSRKARIAERKAAKKAQMEATLRSAGGDTLGKTHNKEYDSDDEEYDRISRGEFYENLVGRIWGFVLFIYHDITLTLGYELVLLGLLIFMAVDTIRVMSWFFFFSIVIMLLMGRERVVTSRFFLRASHVFYCFALIVLQWLYIGHPSATEGIEDINTTYKEAIAKTNGGVRYDYLKYIGVHPDAALVWTTAIAAFLFRLIYSQIPYIEGTNFPAAVIAVPGVIVRDKAKAAGTLHIGVDLNDTSVPPTNMVFESTPEIIKYFEDAIVSHRVAGNTLSFLRPVGLMTGESARIEAERSSSSRLKEALIIKKRKMGEALDSPTESLAGGSMGRGIDVEGEDRTKSASNDFYAGAFNANQRRLLLMMLSDPDSSVRHRAEQELEFTYLTNAFENAAAAARANAQTAKNANGGGGVRVTPAMAAHANKARQCYDNPMQSVSGAIVWVLMCVFITPCFVFADGVSGGSVLHFLIGLVAVFMMVRRRVLYWYPLPMWNRFVGFYIVVLFTQLVCQIPTIAKLIEENIATPKALGFGGYVHAASYYDDGTAPTEPVMPLTAFRVLAIFFCVVQKRIFTSLGFLYHLIDVHNKTISSAGEHVKIQHKQALNEKLNEEAVVSRENTRNEELKKVRQEMHSKNAEQPNGGEGDAAVVEITSGTDPVAGVEAGAAEEGATVNAPDADDSDDGLFVPIAQAAITPRKNEETNAEAENDIADDDSEEKAKQGKKTFKRYAESAIRYLNRHTYLEIAPDTSLPLVARFIVVLCYAMARYFAFILTMFIGINFIVSGSLVDLIPFGAMIVGGIVWRPWAPRLLFVVLLYYTGICIVVKMFIRILSDALTVNDNQSRILSAFFLNMPPNDLTGIRPSDLNRVARGNVTITDLSLDFVVLILIQLHLHIADRVGVYSVDSTTDVQLEDIKGGDESDITQYSTDEDDADILDQAQESETRVLEHHLYYAVRERMKAQREAFSTIMKMDRPYTEDFEVIRSMRQHDKAHVEVLKRRQIMTLRRQRHELTAWDAAAGSKGIAATAAVANRDAALKSADASNDVLKEPPALIFRITSAFAGNIGNICGLGVDLYTITFFWEIITLIVTIFVYPELAGRNTGSIIQSIQDNLLPGPLLAILLIFVLIMVVDRVLYTFSARNAPKANLYKWMYLVFLSIAYGVSYIYWLNDVCARAPLGGPFVMAMKVIYLLLSAIQVYFGYPLFRHHDPFTKRTGLSSTGWDVMMAIPFLWDLRMYLDWCFTRTSLPFEDYLKVEGVHLEVYGRYCRAEDQAEKKGSDQSFSERCTKAGLWFVVIMLIVFFPLMYFSGFNPRLADNPISHVAISMRLDGFGSLYRTERFLSAEETDASQRKAILQMYPSLDLNDYFVERLYQFIEADKCSGDVWGISPQGIDSILAAKPSELVLNLDVSMTRTNSVASDLRISTVSTVSLTEENGKRLQDLVRYSLEAPFNATLRANPPPPAVMQSVYDPFIRNSPSALEPFSSTSDFEDYLIDCEIDLQIIETNISGTPQFVRNWCLTCQSLFQGGNNPTAASYTAADKECLTSFKGCDGLNYADPSSPASKGRARSISGIYFSVASDQVPERLSLIPSDTGIITLYASFVLALAGVIRGRLEGAIHRVVLEECQNPHTLAIYVRYIWMSRGGGRPDRGFDLILEEDLYLEMIDLLRSPDELMRRTSRRQQCYDVDGNRVDLTKMPKW